MKKNCLSSMFKYALLALVVVFTATACSKDDDDPIDDGPKVLDGLYLVGESTALTELSTDGRLNVTLNEVLQEERSTLYEIYVAVTAGGEGFTLQQIAGDQKMVYGPGTDFAAVSEEELDIEEPKNGLWKGSFTETETGFVMPEDGLYHVMIDTELGKVAIAKVEWGVIGGATPGGWSNSTPMAATFNKEKMDFVVEDVVLLENEYKFRYSDGWKVILDAEYDLGGDDKGVKVNTNFGGTLTDLVPGGSNIANTEYGVYKFTMSWELGKDYTALAEKTGDGEPLPEYPENVYMIGSDIGAWSWESDEIIEMIPVHSHPNAFWSIVYLPEGSEFKFSPVKDWIGDFGKSGDATNGVYDKGGDNIVIDEAGHYMVYIDFEEEKISVTAPQVYLIGDAAGGWDMGMENALFTVDNEAQKLISPAFVADANELRMYATCDIATADWWQMEFIVLDGVIEYRGTGGDQDRVAVSAGQQVVLDFVNGTGEIQ